MNQPETQMKHDAQELSVASNANGIYAKQIALHVGPQQKHSRMTSTQMETLLMMRKKLYY